MPKSRALFPPLPSDPRDRLYGRITGSFHVACPACGQLLYAGSRQRKGRAATWRPKASELHCDECLRTWVVGLLLTPVEKGPRRGSRPMDQVPNGAELRQLQAAERERKARQGGAVVAGHRTELVSGRVWRSNLAPECTCAYGEEPLQHVRKWVDPLCPRHGKADEEGAAMARKLVRCRKCGKWIDLEFGKDTPAEHAGAAGTQANPRSPGDRDDICDVCQWGGEEGS